MVMRKRLWCSVVLALATFTTSLTALGEEVPSATVTDRDAVATVVKELDAAWNARDAARFSAVFADDGNFQFPGEGIALRSREEIRHHYAKLFPTLPSDLRHVTTTGEVNAIGPGILAIDIEVSILGADPKTGMAQALLFHYRGMGLGVRTASGWCIRLARVYPATK
jgi:uncharacterized protein (TIGR02246 family)